MVRDKHQPHSLIGELVALRGFPLVARTTGEVYPPADDDRRSGKPALTGGGWETHQRHGSDEPLRRHVGWRSERRDAHSHERGFLDARPLEGDRLDDDVMPVKTRKGQVLSSRPRQGSGYDAEGGDSEHYDEKLLKARRRYAGDADGSRRQDSSAFGERDSVDEDDAARKATEC
jgi:hypothetical protein